MLVIVTLYSTLQWLQSLWTGFWTPKCHFIDSPWLTFSTFHMHNIIRAEVVITYGNVLENGCHFHFDKSLLLVTEVLRCIKMRNQIFRGWLHTI